MNTKEAVGPFRVGDTVAFEGSDVPWEIAALWPEHFDAYEHDQLVAHLVGPGQSFNMRVAHLHPVPAAVTKEVGS